MWRISIDFEQKNFLSSIDCTLLPHIPPSCAHLMHFIKLTYSNSNTMMFSENFCFYICTPFSIPNHWKYGSHILCGHIMYACRWNLHHCTKVLQYLYKKNVLTVQRVYKTTFCEGFQSILNNYFFFLINQ